MDSINWREWSQETLDLAAREDRPILLDISAVWCHWCHVMDQTTYSDPEVIAVVCREYIAVRVDTDRRPDVNSRYNMGGWPSTVFLTPAGEILTGSTYIPPEEMKRLLGQVAAFYREHRGEVNCRVAGMEEGKGTAGTGTGKAGPVPRLSREEALRAVEGVVDWLVEAYDPDFGGFGLEPKFPQVEGLRLLQVAYLRGETPIGRATATGCLQMVERTLRAMRQGGLYDKVEGGFFRYSTTRDWSIPHYEKMLEDNAQLLGLYASMARLTGDDFYLDTVRDIARYLTTTLRSEQGYFFGSQDADEDYYRLDAAGRRERPAPRVDETLYLGWNALAAGGFLQAYLATGEVCLRETGLVALEYAWAACRVGDDGTGSGRTANQKAGRLPRTRLVHYRDDEGPGGPTLLEDYARLALAFLDAYEASGEASFLERAGRVLDEARGLFGPPGEAGGESDGRGGAFYDTPRDGEAAGRLRLRQRGLEENALLALALLRHAELRQTGLGAGDDHPHRRTAEGILAHFLGQHRRQGTLAAGYALALDRWAGPTATAGVSGDRDDPRAAALHFAAAAAVTAAAAVRWAPEGEESGPPMVAVCAGDRCLRPVRDPAEVAGLLRQAASREPPALPGATPWAADQGKDEGDRPTPPGAGSGR